MRTAVVPATRVSVQGDRGCALAALHSTADGDGSWISGLGLGSWLWGTGSGRPAPRPLAAEDSTTGAGRVCLRAGSLEGAWLAYVSPP